MHMMTVKAIADGSGPDITGRTVPMPAGSYHLCREDGRTWFEQRSDVFELQPKDETESPVTATRDASGNVLGLTAGGEQCIVISSDPPSDSDGRVNGTIYIQVLQ